MIRWIVEAIRRGRARERAKGMAWAQELIAAHGVAHAEAELEADLAMGCGYGHWTQGAVEAITQARAAEAANL